MSSADLLHSKKKRKYNSKASEIDVKKMKTMGSTETKLDETYKHIHDENVQLEPPYLTKGDSRIDGKKLLDWILHPVDNQNFFHEIFEKKPLLIQRKGVSTTYSSPWISSKEIDSILRENILIYGVNIDVTSFENGQRETHNQEGRAYAGAIWDFYQTGCSIRLLNPQTFSHDVYEKLSFLQEYVGNFCGANVYLTPPGTQGFAPHWDDIEAFVIQLEGCKRWRVYEPTTLLPDHSSHNLKSESLPNPIIDCHLKAGDLLYFPRGYIHQGNALEDQHSLHITVSMFQQHSYSHLMAKIMPNLLNNFQSKSLTLRGSLPCNYLDAFGSSNRMQTNSESNNDTAQTRSEVIKRVQNMLGEMINCVPDIVDESVDQFALKFMRESLPPSLSTEESSRTIATSGAFWDNNSKSVQGTENVVDLDTKLKLVRKRCIRLIYERKTKTNRLYFNVENTRIYHEVDLKSIELDSVDAKNIKFLIRKYPKFCTANYLKFGDEQSKLELVMGLYEKGILISEKKIETI